MEGTGDFLKNFYPERDKDSRKYDYGLVIVIGGSKIYTGAPVISAMAALRSGVDVAQIIAPQRVANIGASFNVSLTTFPLPGDYLSPEHLSDLVSLTRSGEDASRGRIAIVIGGGVGRSENTKKTVREYIKKTSVPMVIDADAIHAFEDKKEFIHNYLTERDNIIFTPHLYEFYILTGVDIRNFSDDEKSEVVKSAAKKISSTILLKGGTDYISDGDVVEENRKSVPYLTSGGTGDVLAGVAGALLARKKPTIDVAKAAAFINTAAGELASKEKGESLTATDVIDKIYKVIN